MGDQEQFPLWLEIAGTSAAWAAVLLALLVSVRDSLRHSDERRDSEAGRARNVVVTTPKMMSGDAPKITITNGSFNPIMAVQIEHVEWHSPKGNHADWRVVKTIMGAHNEVDLIPGQDSFSTHVEFMDRNGKRANLQLPGSLRVTFTFRDVTGRKWRRVGHSLPTRVVEKPRRLWRPRGSIPDRG